MIKHENVVAFYDFFEFSDANNGSVSLFLGLEYCNQGSLEEIYKNEVITE